MTTNRNDSMTPKSVESLGSCETQSMKMNQTDTGKREYITFNVNIQNNIFPVLGQDASAKDIKSRHLDDFLLGEKDKAKIINRLYDQLTPRESSENKQNLTPMNREKQPNMTYMNPKNHNNAKSSLMVRKSTTSVLISKYNKISSMPSKKSSVSFTNRDLDFNDSRRNCTPKNPRPLIKNAVSSYSSIFVKEEEKQRNKLTFKSDLSQSSKVAFKSNKYSSESCNRLSKSSNNFRFSSRSSNPVKLIESQESRIFILCTNCHENIEQSQIGNSSSFRIPL